MDSSLVYVELQSSGKMKSALNMSCSSLDSCCGREVPGVGSDEEGLAAVASVGEASTLGIVISPPPPSMLHKSVTFAVPVPQKAIVNEIRRHSEITLKK